MTSSILNFFEARSRAQDIAPRGWTNQELAEFYRVADSLNQAGLAVETDLGVSDEGEPWFAFYHPETADVVAHFARINGRFVAAGASLDEVVDGSDLREIIDRMLRTRPMVVPVGKGRGVANMLLHPAIVLTAFVATALLSSHDAEASPLHLGGSQDGAAGEAPAARPAKAAPTLIQKLLAAVDGTGSTSKQNTSEALAQGFQQIALQSAIAFAIAQLPAGSQAVTSGDLLDSSTGSAVAPVKSVDAGTVAVSSLTDLSHGTSNSLQQVAAIATDAAVATGGSHSAADDHAPVALTISGPVTAQTVSLVEATIAARTDASAVANAIHSTPGLMDFLRDLSQLVPLQGQAQATSSSHAAAAAATGSNDTTALKVAPSDAAPKLFEVTIATDASHTAFLQSSLFKELFRVEAVDVTGKDTPVAADGTVTVKFVIASTKAPTTPAPATDAPTGPDTTTGADTATGTTNADAAAPAAAETVVKTGIAMFDHIIDYSVSFAADSTNAYAKDLLSIDSANGHLIQGAKKIVLFDSHDLSMDIYRISDDVVLVDIDLLHLSHGQAAAGHATATMTLPNGGTIELVGVLAPPPGLI